MELHKGYMSNTYSLSAKGVLNDKVSSLQAHAKVFHLQAIDMAGDPLSNNPDNRLHTVSPQTLTAFIF